MMFSGSSRVFFLLGLVFSLLLPASSAISMEIKIFENDMVLEICENDCCKKIKLPQPNYEKAGYQLLDIDGDNIPELIVTEDGLDGAVNISSEIYRIVQGGQLVQVKTNDHDKLFNIKFQKQKMVSSYRESASWHEVIYRYKDGILIREMADRNGESRTIYDNKGNISDYYMLSDAIAWWERKMLRAVVAVEKAKLYNSPNSKDASQMYLILCDSVILKENTIKENKLYYLAEYVSQEKKKIRKWIEAVSLDVGDKNGRSSHRCVDE